MKEKWSRVAFHLLTIWYVGAKSKNQVISGLKVMFNDMGLMAGCTEVISNYPNLVKKLTPTEKKGPNGAKMGTKSLGMGKKSNSTASQSNYSSMHPLNPIGRMGKSQIWKSRCRSCWILVTIRSTQVQGKINRGPLKLKLKMKMEIPVISNSTHEECEKSAKVVIWTLSDELYGDS